MSESKSVEFWNVETLKSFSAETAEKEVYGKKIVVRKLPASIMEQSGEKKMKSVMLEGLVEPVLTEEQFDALSMDIAGALLKAISEFNGLGMEQAEKN